VDGDYGSGYGVRMSPATLTTDLIRGRRAPLAGKPSWRAGDLVEVAEWRAGETGEPGGA